MITIYIIQLLLIAFLLWFHIKGYYYKGWNEKEIKIPFKRYHIFGYILLLIPCVGIVFATFIDVIILTGLYSGNIKMDVPEYILNFINFFKKDML